MRFQLSIRFVLACVLGFSSVSIIKLELVLADSSAQQATAQANDAAIRERAETLLKSGIELREQAKSKDDNAAAQQKLEEAAQLYRSLNERSGEAEALLQLGLALNARELHQESLPIQERALELARGLGDQRREARALVAAGVAGYWVQRYEKAIGYQEQALALWRKLGDKAGEGNALGNLGLIYREMGQDEKGVAYLEQSLPLLRVAGDRKGESSSLNNLSIFYANNQKFDQAFEMFARVRQLAREASNPYNEAIGLMNMGQVRSDQGRFEEALPLLEEALAVQRANGIERRQVVPLTMLGVVQERLGQLDKALDYLQQARAVQETFGKYRIGSVISGITNLQRKLGQKAAARSGLEKMMQEFEEAYRWLRLDEFRTHNLKTSQAVFLGAIDLISELGDAAAAFNIAERARARALLDLLAESRAELRTGFDPALLAEQQATQNRASALRSEMLHEGLTPARRRELNASLKAEEDKLEAITRKLQSANPRYASIRYPQPYNLARVQREVLAPGDVLLEFTLGEARSFVWLVTRDELKFRALPGRAEIERQLEPFLRSLSTRPNSLGLSSALASVQEQGSALAQMLFGAWLEQIARARHVVIVPDGRLYYLPFEALWLPAGQGAHLIERTAISYAPSATVRGELKRQPSLAKATRWELLAFADPLGAKSSTAQTVAPVPNPAPSTAPTATQPESVAADPLKDLERSGFHFAELPSARREAQALNQLFGTGKSRVFLGAQAAKERLAQLELRQFRRLHFATHGVIDEQMPQRSGLLLASSSGSRLALLQLNEILNLELNADLVVLSACQTGLGKLVQGEGMLGLTRAFFYAGARNVVVSLWNVGDVSTATLMESFYRELVAARAAGVALGQAKRKLLAEREPLLRHPYFWAAFIETGAQ